MSLDPIALRVARGLGILLCADTLRFFDLLKSVPHCIPDSPGSFQKKRGSELYTIIVRIRQFCEKYLHARSVPPSNPGAGSCRNAGMSAIGGGENSGAAPGLGGRGGVFKLSKKHRRPECRGGGVLFRRGGGVRRARRIRRCRRSRGFFRPGSQRPAPSPSPRFPWWPACRRRRRWRLWPAARFRRLPA